MAIVEIPVRSDLPSYKMKVTLNGVIFSLHFRFNTRADRWIMSIRDGNEISIVDGIILLNGLFLVGRHKNTKMPQGNFLLIDETGQERQASRNDLGNEFKLLYEEVGA